MMREKLIALSMIKKGDWDDIYRFLSNDRALDTIDEIFACELVQQLNCDVLTLLDDDYPEAWREMSRPPFVAFYKGDIKLLKSKSVSIIGGKEPSDNALKALRALLGAIPDYASVISGFEIGVEMYSMNQATRRIAIIASGLEADEHYQKYVPFKKMNKDDLILSELPPNVKFDMVAYYRSYHLIHELSDMICVFELPNFDLRLKYLAYLTDIGKEVFVSPDIFKKSTSGGLGLVNHGAKLLLRSKDAFKGF